MGTKDEQQWSRISSSSAIFMCFFFIFFANLPSATPLSLSGEIMQPSISTGRSLLQAQKGCPVNFENLNYTVITCRCKGPKYPSKICCEALKDFACPYSDELNDASNNCATTMFSYVNLYGKYPPGLFANECTDSKRGLECTEAQSKLLTNSATRLSVLVVLSAVALLSILSLL